MNRLQEEYLELIGLTQFYLLQEYKRDEWIYSDYDTYCFFKQHAQKTPQPPKPQQENAKAFVSSPPPQISKPKPEPIAKVLSLEPILESPSQVSQAALPSSKNMASKSEFFIPDPLPQSPPADLSDIRKIIAEKFPQQKLLDEPPPPPAAKIADVLILTLDEPAEQKVFLEKVAKAIKERFCSADLAHAGTLEQRGEWDALLGSAPLRLILATEKTLAAAPHLMQYHRILSRGSKHYLAKVPLCIMVDISLYLQDPAKKAALWKAICDELAKTK